MKTGTMLKTFHADDGRTVILRTPRNEDLDDLLELINSLVDEKAEILVSQKFTREEESEWLLESLSRLRKDELFFLIAEVDKRVIASSDFLIQGSKNQVGAVGIVVKNGYREIGIGTQIMKTIFEQAAFLGLKTLTVNVFATNKRAIHVYEKVGFLQTDKIPKKHFRQGKFIDEIVMTKKIE